MVDLMVFGGVAVALAGVVQATARRQRGPASPTALIRESMRGLEGAEAEALRAEFRRSGLSLPERHHTIGF